MTIRLIALVIIVACTTGLFAEEAKLANATKVFPDSRPAYKRPSQYHAFTMRLSPDGKRLLYTRPVAGGEPSDYDSARYELVLRELNGGKEVVLPIEPLDSGWRSVPTRYNIFDPTGKRLVLMDIKIEKQQIDENSSVSRRNINWTIYDIAKSKATNITFPSRTMGPAKFAADGKALLLTVASNRGDLVTKIISLKDPKTKPKSLTAPGWVQSVNPVGDVAAFFVPPARHVHLPQQPDKQMQRAAIRLVLWDLKADEELVRVPTHPRNSKLDDLETQWTSDGRYLYYVDVEEGAAEGEADRPTYRSVTRVWDRQTNKPAGTIPDTTPLGPGPGESTMVLAERPRGDSGGFVLHDAATGKDYQIGDIAKKLIHVSGKKVIYAGKSADSDAEEVFSAEIVLP